MALSLLFPTRFCISSFPSHIRVSFLLSTRCSYSKHTLSQRHFFKHMSCSASATVGGGSDPLPSNDQNGVGGENRDRDDVLVQYIVLRRDLIDTWPLGSVVTQGCHASVAAIWSNRGDDLTVDYCSDPNLDSMHKVTLEVKGEQQILNLSEKLKEGGIAHKLWIEQPENIPTCLATKPYYKSAVSSFFRRLKLCK